MRSSWSWRSRRPETLDSWVVGLCTLMLYVVLQRDALHPPDAHRFLQQVWAGDTATHHFLYLRAAAVLGKVTAMFGLSVFQSMLLLSALGGSVAAVAAHRTMLLLGLPRHRAHAGAWLAAMSPTVLYFATTVEIHVPFLALANLAWWSAATVVASPRGAHLGGAIRTGLFSALCAGMHATGHLVLVPIAALFWLRGRPFVETLLLAGTHAVAILGLAWILTGGTQYLHSSAGLLTVSSWQLDPGVVASAVWTEWLFAFLPISFIALLSLFWREHRRCGLVLHASLLPYLAVSCAVLRGVSERGAYVVPMVIPLAWLATRLLPVAGCVLAAVAGLIVGVHQNGPLHAHAATEEYARDVLLCDRSDRIHVFLGGSEADAFGRGAPSVRSSAIEILGAARGMGEEYFPALCASWDQSLAEIRAAGRRPVFTAAALAFLRAEPGGLLSRMMRDYVDPRCTWQPVGHGSFEAFEPRPR